MENRDRWDLAYLVLRKWMENGGGWDLADLVSAIKWSFIGIASYLYDIMFSTGRGQI